jgi:hypothetical protein
MKPSPTVIMIPNLSKNTEKSGRSFAKDGSYCFIKRQKSTTWSKSNFSELRKTKRISSKFFLGQQNLHEELEMTYPLVIQYLRL